MSRFNRFFSSINYYGENKKLNTVLGFSLFLFIMFLIFFSAPGNFPSGEIISIEKGWGLGRTAEHLHENEIIRHPFLFKLFGFFLGKQNDVVAGKYLFKNDKNSLRILEDVVTGDFGISAISVTIPEGSTVAEIGAILEEKLPSFKSPPFLSLAKEKEGYLFPDTYKFFPEVEASEVAEIMRGNFDQRIKEFKREIETSGKSLDEIITMASIIEEEAHNSEDRKIISGILWKRIELGIPLQVDAAFSYVNGKNTYELTTEDLEEDHPYNTYTNRGLPPGPITNPGLDSILAALRPEKSDYLFYLSDKKGRVYYAEDFEEHKRNKNLYLNLGD